MRFLRRGAEGVLLPVRVGAEMPAAFCEYPFIFQAADGLLLENREEPPAVAHRAPAGLVLPQGPCLKPAPWLPRSCYLEASSCTLVKFSVFYAPLSFFSQWGPLLVCELQASLKLGGFHDFCKSCRKCVPQILLMLPCLNN